MAHCDHDSQVITDEHGTHWRCLRCGEHTCIERCTVTNKPHDQLQCDYCLPDGDCDTVAIATRWCGLAKLMHAARAHTDPTPGDPPPPPEPPLMA